MGFKNHELFIERHRARFRGPLLRSLGASLLSLLGALGLIARLTRHRYLMPPTCIEMIGSAPGAARPDA